MNASHASKMIPPSMLPETFTPDPIVAAVRMHGKCSTAARLAAPALLLGALALVPAAPAFAATLAFSESVVSGLHHGRRRL